MLEEVALLSAPGQPSISTLAWRGAKGDGDDSPGDASTGQQFLSVLCRWFGPHLFLTVLVTEETMGGLQVGLTLPRGISGSG